MDTEQLVTSNKLVKMYAGSVAYGTNLPTSDVDFRGIFCGNPVNIRTPFFPVREWDDSSEEDTKYFELSHFMKLTLDCNPNIIELLWTDDSDIVMRTPAYDYIRSKRSELLSSKIAFTTSGYAMAQLKRINGHNKWINNPFSEAPPKMTDFVKLVQNFTDAKIFTIDIEKYHEGYRLIPYGGNIYGLIALDGFKTFNEKQPHQPLNVVIDTDGDVGLLRKKPLFIVKFNKEEYNNEREKHKQYWDWKKNRNVVRSALEEEHGFDSKHAMHLVRLLRIGKEALRDEEIIVKRPDATELLDIRNGSMTYDEIIKYAASLDTEIREVWYKKTKLPKRPNLHKAAEILMTAQDMIWNGQ